MRSEKIANVRPPPESMVTVKKCGNITELRYQQCNMGGSIQKWDKDNYIDLKTGEFKEFKHSNLRVSHLENISRSLRNLRDIINTNATNVDNCQWVTLTYQENMTDTKRLYNDFHNFNKRYQNYIKQNSLPKCEYIAAAEPQGRGAWHLHIIFIFPEKAPFVENDKLAKIWGQGFVKITSLKNVDNVGIYLSAYLADMDVPKDIDIDIEKFKENNKFKIVNADDENGNKCKKAIIKGARLYFYPTGFNIYRHSRGIKNPEIYETTEADAMKELGGAVLHMKKPYSFQMTERLLIKSTIGIITI